MDWRATQRCGLRKATSWNQVIDRLMRVLASIVCRASSFVFRLFTTNPFSTGLLEDQTLQILALFNKLREARAINSGWLSRPP